MTTLQLPEWGTEKETLNFEGRSYQIYRQRPTSLNDVKNLAQRWGDRPYIVQGETTLSFAGFLDLVRKRQEDLVSRGVGRGDRVAILGWNSPEWIINFWAVTGLGAVAVLVNAWWTASELDEAFANVEPSLVLADARLINKVGDGYEIAPWESPDVVADDNSAVEVETINDENAPAAVIFTSGSSGTPKAALLSHRSLLAGLQMLLHVTKRLPHQVTDDVGEAALHTGPMFHVGGVQTLLRAICVGDTLVMPVGKFDPEESLRLIEEWTIRRWSAVPTMLHRVIDHPDAKIRDISSLRSLTVGGAAVHPELMEKIRTGLPGVDPKIATGFGLTENGGQAVAASGRDTLSKPGSTGRALPCVEIRIAESVNGQDGEILLRSPTQMLEYIGVDESPIDTEGWLSTGDLGRLDEDEYLWITGRSKDMIIRGGENIAPAAVERALMQTEEIVDAVVFGVPDEQLGETVAAVVVSPDGFDENAVKEQLRARLAGFAVPEHWVKRSEALPENHAGKIDRNLVIAEAMATLRETTAVGS